MEFKHTGRTHTRRPLVAACVIALLLQLALAPQISLFGGRINFMLVLVATAAVGGESRILVYLGFAAGMLFDLTSAVPLGLMALLLTLSGYAVANMTRGIAPGVHMDALRMSGVCIAAVNLIYAIAMVAMGVTSGMMTSLGIALASTLLDIVVAVPFLALLSGGEQGRGFSARGGNRTRYRGLR
ncbi:rod shape-determining protein MreD [Corynebacterium sp.]|uniref:rod shape-determining protein MreD n=1 Tax=Corynebacterium sp. TaxID=1720 RepID=UPI0026DAE1E9|nr:rod shape-determining protein MreD [Corynebacterium sp.]MDO5032538.1 rod shape-determining protein MreD [Corynebacterium sp.]